MKKSALLFLSASFFVINYTFSQCAFDNTNLTTITLPGCPGSASVTCMHAGDAASVNVTAGNIYTFSTCGSTAFDSEITLYDNAGITVLGYNDDFCGTQSQITWTATYSGVAHVLLDAVTLVFHCNSNTTCMDLNISCTIPSASGVGCNTDNTICTAGTAGPFTFGIAGANPLNCQNWLSSSQFSYIVLYITQSGPLNILINGNATTGFLDVSIYNIPPGQTPCNSLVAVNMLGCNYADFSGGCNEFGTSFGCSSTVPAPNVVAGQVVMIIVEDYTNGPSTNYTLQLAPIPSAQTGPPNPTITPVGPYCENDVAVQLSAVNMGGTWTGPGVSSSGLFTPALAGPGTHIINYSIGQNPCNANSSTTIVVSGAPTFTLAGTNPTACNSTDGFITISGLIASSNYSISYTDGGSTITLSSISSSIGTIVISNLNSGIYSSFTLSINGCTGSSPTTITIVTAGSSPVVNPAPDIQFCSGNTETIGANSILGNTYSWSPTFGLSNSSISNPTISLTNTTQNPIYLTYTLTIISSSGCLATDEVIVTVNPIPVVNFISDITKGCSPLTIHFTNLVSPIASSNIWNFGDGTTLNSTDEIVSHTFLTENCFDISLTSQTSDCSFSQTIPQMICTLPKSNASIMVNHPSMSALEPSFSFENLSTNSNSYTWYFGDGNSSSAMNPSHTYEQLAGNYIVTLVASTDGECSDTTYLKIQIIDELIYYVPNTFTPDNDNYNQTFQPVFTSGFDPYCFSLLIFNRWGEIVFESKNAAIGWDGIYNGKTAPEGSYTWKINFSDGVSDKRYTDSGNISLLR